MRPADALVALAQEETRLNPTLENTGTVNVKVNHRNGGAHKSGNERIGDTMPQPWNALTRRAILAGWKQCPKLYATKNEVTGAWGIDYSDSVLRRINEREAHKPHQGERECQRRRLQRP